MPTTGCHQQGHVRSQIMVVILSQFCFNEEVLTVKKVLVAKLSLKILASELIVVTSLQMASELAKKSDD